MRFILTIDTEADNQWNHGIPLSTQNIHSIPRFQELFEKCAIRPTYLVTSEVCGDEYARTIFRDYLKRETAEVGAHLHAWTTPPFQDVPGLRFNDRHHPFATELTESLLGEKIATLTHEIETAFGIRPTSFRSGRFGFNETCAGILLQHGYLVDSSVTPYVNWSRHPGLPNGNGGPDFVDSPVQHYFFNTDQGNSQIPVTILATKWPFSASESLMRTYCRWKESVTKKVVRKLMGEQPVWLRPFSRTTEAQLQEIVDRAKDHSLEFIAMMFHSSELMAGKSKYRSKEEDVDALFELLKGLFEYLNASNVPSLTLSEAAQSLITRR